VAIFNYHWVPAPIGEFYGEGRRWKLMRGNRFEGCVVQLREGSPWKTDIAVSGYTSDEHDSIGKAALALLHHLEQRRRKPGEPLTAKLGDFLQLKIVK
jgi:hypothetical protein